MAEVKDTISLDEAIDFLNELIELDRPAMAALVVNRVPCNEAMADHPTVQVGAQHGGFSVGALDIISGMFGIHDGGCSPITQMIDGDEREKLLCLRRTQLIDRLR